MYSPLSTSIGTIWLGGNEENSSTLQTSITACHSFTLSLFTGSGLMAIGLLSSPIPLSIRQRCSVRVDKPITSHALSCLTPAATTLLISLACFCLSVSGINCPLFPSNRHRTFFLIRAMLRFLLTLYPFCVALALIL